MFGQPKGLFKVWDCGGAAMWREVHASRYLLSHIVMSRLNGASAYDSGQEFRPAHVEKPASNMARNESRLAERPA